MTADRYRPPARQVVLYGEAVDTALPKALSELWASHTVLVGSDAICAKGGLAETLQALLGERNEKTVPDVQRFAARGDVVRITEALRNRGTEAMVVAGGGSVMDAAKAARICLTNNVSHPGDFERLRTTTTAAAPRPYMIAIPTTLSGAEFTPLAWIADAETDRFQRLSHQDLAPDFVILDPRITLGTPHDLWLASGVAALGRAVQSWLVTERPQPLAGAACLRSIALLAYGLRVCHRAPDDLAARQICQEGAWLSGMLAGLSGHTYACEALSRQAGLKWGIGSAAISAALLPELVARLAGAAPARAGVVADALGAPRGQLPETFSMFVAGLGLQTRIRDMAAKDPGEAGAGLSASVADMPGLALGPLTAEDLADCLDRVL